jgi:hypothetical protein
MQMREVMFGDESAEYTTLRNQFCSKMCSYDMMTEKKYV